MIHRTYSALILRGSQCRRKGGILGGGAQNWAQKGRAAREVWGYAAPESFKKCYFQRSPTAICNLCVTQITSHTVLAKLGKCRLHCMSFYDNFIFLNNPMMVKTMEDVQVWILEVPVFKPLKCWWHSVQVLPWTIILFHLNQWWKLLSNS